MEIEQSFGGVNGGNVVESWQQQLDQRENQLVELHKTEQDILKEANDAIVKFREAIQIAPTFNDQLPMTLQLSEYLDGFIFRLKEVETQQYAITQIGYTDDRIQGRQIVESFRENAKLIELFQQQIITTTNDRNTIANEKNALATNLENTKQLALTAQEQLDTKTKEYNQLSANYMTQITKLNNDLSEVIEKSSKLEPTQQQLALITNEKENLKAQLADVSLRYNNNVESAKQTKETYDNMIARYEADRKNLEEQIKNSATSYEQLRLEANRQILVLQENTQKMVDNEKQLAISQVNAAEDEKKAYFAQLNKLQEEVRQKQSRLTVTETELSFLKSAETEFKKEKDQLTRLLENAQKDRETKEANLLAAQQKAQEEFLRSQSLSNQVKELQNAQLLMLTGTENESAKQQLVIQNEEIEDMRTKLADFQSRLSRAQKEIGDAEQKQKDGLAEIASLKKINDMIRESLENTNESNKKQREVEDKERDRLLSTITTLEQEVDTVKTALRQQSQLITVAQDSETERLRKELENATKKNREDFVKISTLERTIEEKDRAITLSNSSLDQEELEKELLRVETKLKNEEARATQLEIKLVGTQKSINELEELDKQRQALSDTYKRELELSKRRHLEATKEAQKSESEKLDLFNRLNAIDSSLNRIQLYELNNDQIRPLIDKLDVNDTKNSELIQSNKAMRSKLEKDIQHAKALNAMEVFTGTTGYRKIEDSDLQALTKYVLATKFMVGRVVKTLEDSGSNSSTNTTSTTTTISTTTTSKRTPTITLGASALHSLNQFEMIAQTEWLSLNRQLSEPGEYSVEISFSRDMREEFHFKMRDVHLLANPNDTAGGERFFVVDLTSPGDRVIYGLGSMGVADVIYGKGEVDFIVREKKSNTIVKQETLAYEFVPQKNLQYNTKVSARVDSIIIHARYLGTSYVIEDILIRQ